MQRMCRRGWRLLAPTCDSTRSCAPTRAPAYLYRPELAGRGRRARTRWVRTSAGCSEVVGGCVMLGGESGVGKTSVVAELARTATIQQLVVVAGECQPIGGGVLHPLVPLLGRIIDRAVEGGPAATATLFGNRARVLAAIEPNVSRVPGFADCPAAGRPARRRGACPAARRPPRNDRGVYRGAPGAPDPRRPAMGGRPHPGVPAHDAPAVFRTQRAAPARYLPFRGATATVARCAGALQSIVRFDLGRLDTAAVGAMVGDMLAPDRSAARVRRVRDGSIGGESVLRRRVPAHRSRRATAATDRGTLGLRRRGRRRRRLRATGAAGVAPRAGRPAPGRPARSVRMALAQIAAVLGREMDAALLLVASRMPEADAMDAIRELGARQVLDRAEGGRYRFLHDKLRETAYANIPGDRRSDVHRQAAESLEAVLWHHERIPTIPGESGVPLRTRRRSAARHRLSGAAPRNTRRKPSPIAKWRTISPRPCAWTMNRASGSSQHRRTAWRTSVGMALRGLGELEQSRTELEQIAAGGGVSRADPLEPRGCPARPPRVDAASLARVAAGCAARERCPGRARPQRVQLRRDDRVSPERCSRPAVLRRSRRSAGAPCRAFATGSPALRRRGKRPRLRRTEKAGVAVCRASRTRLRTPPDKRCRMASSISTPATSPRCWVKWTPSTTTSITRSTSTPASATRRFREEALANVAPSAGPSRPAAAGS